MNDPFDSVDATKWVGRRVRRFEDGRLLRGEGRFVADVATDGYAHAVVFRSRVAAGIINKIDREDALKSPGVIAVLTGADARADELGGIPWEVCPPGFEHRARFSGDPAIAAPQPILARDRVLYVGEPIALVVADSPWAAMDACDKLVVDIEETPPGVAWPAVVPDDYQAPTGSVFYCEVGDRARMDALMANADHVVEINAHVPRLSAAPLETRGYMASFNADTSRWTLIASAGKPHPARDTIARHVLRVEPDSIHLIAPDVGGGFGAKNVAHAEMALVLWASKRLGTPVRWIGGRMESFVSDMQGRDHAIGARLAFNRDGRFLAIGYHGLVNLGAYLGARAVIPATSGLKILTGPYEIDTVFARVDASHTNTTPTCPYRGAGIPETAFVVERLVDMAARRLGMDPMALRRQNLLSDASLPWRAPTGSILHSARFTDTLDLARERSNWSARGERPRGGATTRGIGMAFTIEPYGTTYDEAAEIMAHGDRRIEILIGTKSSGQSHETTYAQIAGDALDLHPDRFAIIQGDTDRIERGHGTGASRSLTTGGSAILRAAEAFLVEARAIAARLLQCSPAALRYAAGAFALEGDSGARIDIASIARSTEAGFLHVKAAFRPAGGTFPYGCHIAEVEVDTATGSVALLRYTAVQDAGVAINPMIVEAQMRGGIAQGIGAALMEATRVDDHGQPVTGSFLDYALPRSGDLPSIDVVLMSVPCASNPLGAKPVGEAGTVGAPPAIVNAIVDALSHLGVEHVELPATSANVWKAIVAAGRAHSRNQ